MKIYNLYKTKTELYRKVSKQNRTMRKTLSNPKDREQTQRISSSIFFFHFPTHA